MAALFMGYSLAAGHAVRAVRSRRRPLPFLIVPGTFGGFGRFIVAGFAVQVTLTLLALATGRSG